jgi:meiotic recombination protein DMC1
MQKSKRDE